MREISRSATEDSFTNGNSDSQTHVRPEKPKAFYIVFGTFLFLTMIVGSIIFLAFLSIRKV